MIPKGGALGLEDQAPSYDPKDYTCKCFGRFEGTLCDTPIDNTCGSVEACLNGGTCIKASSGSRMCSCIDGFVGAACEEEGSELLVADTRKRGLAWGLTVTFVFALLGFAHFKYKRREAKSIEFSVVSTTGDKPVEATLDFKNPQSVWRLYTDASKNLRRNSNELV